jgi:hypothetical protein
LHQGRAWLIEGSPQAMVSAPLTAPITNLHLLLVQAGKAMRPSPAGSGIGDFSFSNCVTIDGLRIGAKDMVLVGFGGAGGLGGLSIVDRPV